MPESSTATINAPAGFVPRAAISFGGDGVIATAVDDAHPLPIASGAPGTANASIAGGASLSGAVDLAGQRVHRIVVPSGWTTAAISFQSSHDGTSWSDLFDAANGEVAITSATAAAGRAIVVDPAAFLGVRFLKLRSGTAAAAVAQAAARDVTLVTVAR